MNTFPTLRDSGSTRGFTTIDPERQGVLARFSDPAGTARASSSPTWPSSKSFQQALRSLPVRPAPPKN